MVTKIGENKHEMEKQTRMTLPSQTTKYSFKTVSFSTLIDEDDDDFGEMKMVKVLVGRRRFSD